MAIRPSHRSLATAFAACWPSSESSWRKAIWRYASCWLIWRRRSGYPQDARCVRLCVVIGIGAIAADAAVATTGNAHELKRRRQMSAWQGLVPTQHSSGGMRDWARSAVAAMRTGGHPADPGCLQQPATRHLILHESYPMIQRGWTLEPPDEKEEAS